jgi:hypothetical protein
MLARFLDDIREGDMIAPRRMAERLRVPMTQMARLAHVSRNTLTGKAESPLVQAHHCQGGRAVGRRGSRDHLVPPPAHPGLQQ